jgi:hypothetical protein
MAMYRVADLDVLSWQGPVIDRDLSTPPGSPTKGDRYIVKATGTGDWAGHDNAITYYNGSAWVFIAPVEGLICWVKDEDIFLRHNGTIWDVLVPAGGGLGYAMAVFTTNVTAVADLATLYFGNYAFTAQTAADTCRVYIPKAGTIKAAEINVYSTTIGSNENVSMYIRLNNLTDTLIQTRGMGLANALFANTSLSIAVVAGDYIEIKVVCPTWATNPAAFRFGGSICVE